MQRGSYQMAIADMRNLSAAQLHHAADAAPGSLHDVLRQGDFLAAAALQAMVNVHQGGQFHVHAGKLHGQRIEPLFRASIGEVLHDAVFRADDELFGIGLFCISHNAGGRANIISLLHDLGAAFGMNQKQRLRVGSAGFG